MAGTTYYRQMQFQSGTKQTTAWVPEDGLKVGNRVTFEGEDPNEWWTIKAIGEKRVPESDAKTSERAYLKQRSVSDI